MKEHGLEQRHRDKDVEIAKKHATTRVGALRIVFGAQFAAGFKETAQLADISPTLADHDRAQLRELHDGGSLEQEIDDATAEFDHGLSRE